MRRTLIALAACAVVTALVVAPAASGKKKAKGPRVIGGTVTLVASSPTAGTTSTTASGNVKAQASCRKGRTVHLVLNKADGTPAGAEVLATTMSNGDYTATVAVPVTPGSYSLSASVDQLYRKSGKGKHAKKFICSALTSAPVAITVPTPPVV